ncbi:hypothetical protein O0L34_g14906 [Tuta absoluta]|nr:hypothetical protein O0L34_g14906 [Tuta absoluta]
MKQYIGTRIIQRTYNRTKPIKAAIVVFDDSLEILECPKLTTENLAVAIIKTNTWTLAVASIYFEDHLPIEPYIQQLEHIKNTLDVPMLLVGGDVNAWSTWWGSVREDHRGEILAGTLNDLGMHILNEGDTPTFDTIRGNKQFKSHVDITSCTHELLHAIDNWKIEEGMTSSDHNAITFSLVLGEPGSRRPSKTTRKYNTRKANWSDFTTTLQTNLQEKRIDQGLVEKITSKEELEAVVGEYIHSIEVACENSIPKVKKKKKINFPWLTEELCQQKQEVATKKRRIRCAAACRKDAVVREYLEAKTTYEEKAMEAQVMSWKEFCTKQDRESVWDGIYRVIGQTSKRHEDMPMISGNQVMSPEESVAFLTSTFFPADKENDDSIKHAEIRVKARNSTNNTEKEDGMDPPFTIVELREAICSFNPKKAPGPDGFTADICQSAIMQTEDVFLAILNKCLEISHFPIPWKEAAVIVLRKPGKKNYNEPKSYRPIGLLPVMGKILEKIMIRRIKWHVLPKANPRQYGFVPQRCTEDSLYDLVQYIKDNLKKKLINIVISLDIEGAFDSAWWPAIQCRLQEKSCPLNLRKLVGSYFEERKVRVRYMDREHVENTTKGCVQGSIGGPTFWNLLLDPLLDELEQRNVYCQAFADDVVLVFTGTNVPSIQEHANSVLDRVYEWGIENKLKFAPHKTNAMVITKKLKFDVPVIHMGPAPIEIVDEIKILGLILDKKLTFNSHVTYVCKKAINIYRQLARAARISWGLNSETIRTIYIAVIEPIVLYAASVWAGAAEKITIQKQLNTVQRGFAQKICKAYRTVSLNSALILAGLLPLDLRVREAAQLFEAKRGRPFVEIFGDRQIEERVCFLEAPHPAAEVEISFQCLENMLPETMEKYELTGPHIFTDGSKIEGKVGAALTRWTDGEEEEGKKFKLEPFCTVFQAEMYALKQAVQMAKKYPVSNIFSDSKSSLDLLKSRNVFHPLAFIIKREIAELRSQNKRVNLFWIRAHVGVPGNERADQLAKEAALRLKTRAHYDRCPVSFVKKRIREDTIEKWNARYKQGETAAITKIFLPEATTAHRVIRRLGLTPVLVQMLTGHGGFAEYLCRFKLKDSAGCICDQQKAQTVPHITVECPVFESQRTALEIEIEQKITLNSLKDILANKKSRGPLKKFMINVANHIIKSNKTK